MPRTQRGQTAIVISALMASLAVGALFSSCGTPQIEITLQDIDDKRTSAVFAEALVYAKGCPGLVELSAGQIGSPLKRQVVSAASGFKPFGEIESGPHGFAALLRDFDCSVVASGCTTADLGSVRKVTIPVGAVIPPQGACDTKTVCIDAACESNDGGLDGGIGSGSCPLTLVKAGTLPQLVEPGGSATGPALIASAGGFLLAYREASTDMATASATLVEISDDGTLGMPSRQGIPTCAPFVASDGVALAQGQTGGLLLVSRPDCGDAGMGAGFTVLPFDTALTLGSPIATPDVGATSALALSHALIPFDDAFQAFYVVGGSTAYQARIGLDGSLLSTPLLPAGTSVFAQIAATPNLWAELVGTPAQTRFTVRSPSPIAPPMGGGGAGGAGGAGGTGSGTGTGGMDAGAPPQSEFTVARSLSAWGAVAAWSTQSGDRALAASLEVDGTLTWGAMDRAGLPLGTGTSASAHTATDVAVLRDHAFVVAARQRGFRLLKLSGARGPSLAQDGLGIDENNVVGGENLGNYDGVRIAIAAARTRVIVAWITRNLGTTDETGGFALYACDK